MQLLDRLFKSVCEKIDNFIKELRAEHDKRYNEFLLLDHLTSPDVDVLISISNRTDGKTYAHLKVLLKLSKKFGFTFCLICRHFTLRKAYIAAVTEIMNEENIYTGNELGFYNHEDIMEIQDNQGNIICGVTDLNSASDLKYRALQLRHYNLNVYDEFIAMEHEYLEYEVEAMKVIYETMDRDSNKRILKNPKILFMGNAMNFSSPFIAYWDLFQDIERQQINTLQIYSRRTQDGDTLRIAVELRRNENVNKSKNSKIFNMGGNNYAMSGEFNTNKFLLSNDTFEQWEYFCIRFNDKYIKVYYTDKKIVLGVINYSPKYRYCNKIYDMKQDVKFMTDKYFDPVYQQCMYNGMIKYANTYSLRYISDDDQLCYLKYKVLVNDMMYQPQQIEDMRANRARKNSELEILSRFYE